MKDASEPLTLTVIEHPGGEFRFGDSKLIVREIFETFWSLLESEDAEWQKLVQSPGVARRFHYPHHATIITGQPGIGQYTIYIPLLVLTYRIQCTRKNGLSDLRTSFSDDPRQDHNLL